MSSLHKALLTVLLSLSACVGNPVREPIQNPTHSCGASNLGYHYEPTTGNCYKYSRRAEYWPDARAICKQDGGDLAIINSDIEAKLFTVIQKAFEFNIDCHERGPCSGSWVAIGAVYSESGKPLTVDNQTLAEAGYAPTWVHEGGNHGYMLTDGRFTDLDGSKWSCPYICEKAAV